MSDQRLEGFETVRLRGAALTGSRSSEHLGYVLHRAALPTTGLKSRREKKARGAQRCGDTCHVCAMCDLHPRGMTGIRSV